MGDASILNLNEITELVDFHRSTVAVHLKKGDQIGLKIVFQADKKPNIFLFTNRKDTGLAAFEAAVQDVRGKMISARFHDSDFADAFQHFGLEQFIGEATLPKVLIEDRKHEQNYLMEGDVDETSVRDFIFNFMDGNLTPVPK